MAQFVHNTRKRSSWALDTALVKLWRSFGSQEIDDDVRQLDWAPGCSQGPAGRGNLNFSIPPKPLRMRFCAQIHHCQGIHVVLCAAAGMQRLLHAHKRRGGGGAILRPERAKNRLQTLPERGPESIRAKEHPGRQVLSEWSKNGRIGAQGWLSAAHVPPFPAPGGRRARGFDLVPVLCLISPSRVQSPPAAPRPSTFPISVGAVLFRAALEVVQSIALAAGVLPFFSPALHFFLPRDTSTCRSARI